ncbi:hypothetical protein MHN79_08705 [Vibrio sp. Of14-4]|uniref:hypothetical protein n=1 Tax=Vibrio sp. Of14-4 TaxID=2724878 RepID=UPI001EF251FE|nr:hypothetical protein [Vibrio sp. Of14-4]MCG7489569.1 hypothetical protein [Vibrio sp. Of14-4]
MKTSLLRSLRLRSGYPTATKFAKELGLNIRTVNAHELGTRPINEKYARIYADVLSVDDWRTLLTKKEVEPSLLFHSFNREMEAIIYISTILSEIKNINTKQRVEIISSLTRDNDIINRYYNEKINKETVIKECLNVINSIN